MSNRWPARGDETDADENAHPTSGGRPFGWRHQLQRRLLLAQHRGGDSCPCRRVARDAPDGDDAGGDAAPSAS